MRGEAVNKAWLAGKGGSLGKSHNAVQGLAPHPENDLLGCRVSKGEVGHQPASFLMEAP